MTVEKPEAGIVQFGPEDKVAVAGNLDGVLRSVPLTLEVAGGKFKIILQRNP